MAVYQLGGSWYDRDEFDSLLERIQHIKNETGETKTQIVTKAIADGVTQREKELSEELNPQLLARVQELVRIKNKKRRSKEYEQILEERGREGFMEWCQAAGQDSEDYTEFLDGYTWRMGESWHYKLETWLNGYLADGKAHPTKEIRTVLETANLLNGSERDWDRARAWASRNGYTIPDMPGYWRLPGVDINLHAERTHGDPYYTREEYIRG